MLHKVGVQVGLQDRVIIGLQRNPNWSPTTSLRVVFLWVGISDNILLESISATIWHPRKRDTLGFISILINYCYGY